MKNRIVHVAAIVLLVAGCSDLPSTSPVADEAPVLTAAASIPGISSAQGVLGPGALYQILVPDSWDGTLILYAHGYAESDAPPRLPDPTNPSDGEGQILLGLTQRGAAVAYSSFSENGLAIKDGVQRTRQLRGIFVSQFGIPDRTIAMGLSLGGAIALKLIEDQPSHYVGGLTLCGLVGGTQSETDYLSQVRVLFDVFYPGVLPGDLFNLPQRAQVPALLGSAFGAMIGNPAGAAGMQAVMTGLGTPIPGAGFQVFQSIFVALLFNLNRYEDILKRTNRQHFFDNATTDYGDAAVNAAVDRFVSTPAARAYLANYYEPTGRLGVPLVTLHTSDDPAVPAFHPTLLAQAVAAAGNSAQLQQVLIPRFGHCNFAPQEIGGALDLLEAQIGS